MEKKDVVVTEEVETVVTPEIETKIDIEKTKKDWLRDLSKDLGINAFDPKEVKAKFDKMTEWEETQKSEQEKLQEKLTSYETQANEWNKKETEYKFKFAAFDKQIDPSKIDKLFKLTDGDTKNIDEVLKEFPSFVKQTQNNTAHVKFSTKEEPTTGGTVPPVLAAFRAKRKK